MNLVSIFSMFDLAQIKTGVRVVAEPGKDRQDVRPILGVGERQKGFRNKPVAQLREALLRRSVKPFEALCVFLCPNQSQASASVGSTTLSGTLLRPSCR